MLIGLNVYFINQNIMRKGDPMEVNFEVLKTQKIKYINGQKSQSRQEKWGHLPYYHIYS